MSAPKSANESSETRYPQDNGFLKYRDWFALAFVAGLPLIFYWRATLGLGMFFFGDIARYFYPTRGLYAEALRAGRLPLWQPEILMGIPLHAEMQTGALYPLHLVLYRFLPIDLALNYDILLHLAWLAVGMFLFARIRKISTVGAMLAAMALTLGGFGAARITHPNVLAVAAWLPWVLYLYEQWRGGWHTLVLWTLLVIVFALQWLGGHPQFALINCVVFGVYVLWRMVGRTDDPSLALGTGSGRRTNDSAVLLGAGEEQGAGSGERGAEEGRKRGGGARELVERLGSDLRVQRIVVPLAALLLGTLIAAVQLAPTFEFSQQSARAGGVGEEFFTTFSYHPAYLALLVAPFLRGNPYPQTSVEVMAYIGLVPLIFAVAGLVLRRERDTYFWGLLALGALLLALGGNTPLYPALRGLPLLNLFRVPARFLLPFSFALAMLAGIGFDALRERTFESKMFRNALFAFGAAVAAGLLVLILVNVLSADVWVDAWRGLPILFGALAILLVLRASRMDRVFFTICALGLTIVDLFAFSAVYAQTYNQIAPRAEIFPRPRVLEELDIQSGARVLTSEWILPWTSVMNESLFPNLNAAHGVTAAHGYTPLTPRNTREFLDDLSPVMLNKLGVQYFMIPQLLPVDPKTEAADVFNPFLLDPVREPLKFSIVDSDSIEIESSLAQSADLPNNALVANVILTDENGKEYTVQLLAGRDTAEWAYDRSDVTRAIQHARPEPASSFAARSAFPIENHVGHVFRTRLNFADTVAPIVQVRIEPVINPDLLHIQRLALLTGDAAIDLAPLLGKGRHELVYRSEDVTVFENPDWTPRAFITHNVKRADDAEAFRQMRSEQPNAEIYVAAGPEFESDTGQGFNERADIVLYEPERVVVEAQLDFDGYLVLTDTWDEGWTVLVDGAPATMTRADVIFRAVLLPPGTHRVEFLYRPTAFYVGLVLTGVGIALVGIVVLGVVLGRVRRGERV